MSEHRKAAAAAAWPAGLSEAEAVRRLEFFGPNELARPRSRKLVAIVLETLREPMFLLLIGAAGLYLVLGDLGEGLFLTVGAMATIGLVVFQEARSERALEALRRLAEPQARAVREGAERRLAARLLVPGDIVLVGEGERLPADGQLVAGEVLGVDESILTGESAPVLKQPVASNGPDANRPDFLLSAGTMVVRGQGVMEVSQTGPRSALGRIGASLSRTSHEPTPLQKTAGRLVGWLGLFALAFCALVAVAYGVLRHDWVGGALSGVTVAISLIPEEFPMVLAVFLALGAWRLASHHVLVRRSAVIEALGGASVLCVDKTGTLTENRMRLARLWTPQGEVELKDAVELDASAAELLRLAALASAVRPVDPMDRAIRLAAGEAGRAEAHPERAWPLRPELLAVIQLWRTPGQTGDIAAAKGAPEAIFHLCRLADAEVGRLHALTHRFAEQGLRVLGVAFAEAGDAFPDEPLNADFHFAGLLGFLDPVRAEVPAALAEASRAGVKVVMLTGDHPATALAVARVAGLDASSGVLSGAQAAGLSLEGLGERLEQVRVFARIAPDQKLRIVQALKAKGEVVAMTGDGVNDAPALEAADIGIAMGRRGADVAREAADLILLDDSFASIVGGVRLGRRIFANLRRALIYITAIHVPVAGLALGPILLGLPPMLFPMHVVLLELVIDPTCSLVFEAEPSGKDAMRRPPRRRDEALFGPRQIAAAVVQGLVLLAGVLGLYGWSLLHYGEAQARGAAFLALAFGNLVLALADSAGSLRLFAPHRRIYWAITAFVAIALTVVLALPGPAAMFKVQAPPFELLALALATALAGGGWSALIRWRALGSAPPPAAPARTPARNSP